MKFESNQNRKPEVEQEQGDAEETPLRSLYFMKKEIKKQAVVVIHGMGEQKPMDTIRGFVDAVLDKPGSGEKYYSKPNEMSESFELRKLQNRTEPRTDFFEYYWAHKVKGTTIGQVISWAISLLLRRPWHLPGHVLPYWLISWFLIAIVVWGAINGKFDFVENIDTASFAVVGIGTVIFGIIQGTIANSLGDAVRYFNPNPQNIDLRQSIRSDGIKLLRRIHDCGEYSRIIVVGHSLGSVIAYDILKHLWEKYYEYYNPLADNDQPALKEVEALGKALSPKSKANDIEKFRDAQYKLWQELRALGNPWLVTDLITAGSPLYHAALILAKNEEDLDKRQNQRELPICPPILEVPVDKNVKDNGYSYEIWPPFKMNNDEFKIRRIHSAGHFAFVRWTNLYFPTKCLIFGDFACGPLSKWFGPGIKNIAVTTSKWRGLAKCTIKAHSCYWFPPDRKHKKICGKPTACDELINSLKL
jgi:hypothetical protein